MTQYLASYLCDHYETAVHCATIQEFAIVWYVKGEEY